MNADRGAQIALFAGLALLTAAMLWLPGRGTAPDLDASAAGTDGLAVWLRDQGLSARAFDGVGSVRSARIGLRVLPLHDAEPDRDRAPPVTEIDLILQQSERDIEAWQLRRKLRQLPTLAVLPKWRAGMRLLRAVHPDLLIDAALLNGPEFDELRAGGTIIRAPGVMDFAYTPFGGAPLTARIHAPQTLAGADNCTPIIGTRQAMLLGRCLFDPNRHTPEDWDQMSWYGIDQPQDGYWLLADPDLINNHGLTQGDNAAIAAMVIGNAASGEDVIVDQISDFWRPEVPDARREREWSDLAPLFAPPFTALWAGLAALAGLMIWRGGVRFGAPLPGMDAGPGASRAVAVDATARLLRLSGHDGALLSAWSEQRLAAAAAALLGPHRKSAADPGAQLAAWLARRDPDGARALDAAIAAARAAPADADPGMTLRLLEDFEAQLEQVLHDAGRPFDRR